MRGGEEKCTGGGFLTNPEEGADSPVSQVDRTTAFVLDIFFFSFFFNLCVFSFKHLPPLSSAAAVIATLPLGQFKQFPLTLLQQSHFLQKHSIARNHE